MNRSGALAQPELDHRSVYRFDPKTGDLTRMADFEQPNGLAFTADGATLYVSDTSLSLGEVPGHKAGTKHEIIAFDVSETGTLSNRRLFCHTDHGYPDGFTVDGRGWVWTSAAERIFGCMTRQRCLVVEHGKQSFPLADVLREREVPFVFASGYGADGLIDGYSEDFVLQNLTTRMNLNAPINLAADR